MIPRKPPPRLEDAAFRAWLTAMDEGACVPSSAPGSMLSRAIRSVSRLREATIVRIVAAAAAAGVGDLHVEGEFLNQALLQQLAGALTTKPDNLERLTLDLSPRVMDGPAIAILANALKHTNNLRELRLSGGACDEILQAVAMASSPLVSLDLSYSKLVTDAGIEAILNFPPHLLSLRVSQHPMPELQHINVWGTRVTTRGCIKALKYCSNLVSLTCQWTPEALILLEMQESNPLSLEQLLIVEEEFSGNLFTAIVNLCPCLKVLTIRRPKDPFIDIVSVTQSLPHLQKLSALQFLTPLPLLMEVPHGLSLTHLHLTPLSAPTVYLDELLLACPALAYLTLEGVTPSLMNTSLLQSGEEERNSSSNRRSWASLKELKLITNPISAPLDPDVIMWFIGLMPELNRIQLGCCKLFQDGHILDLLRKGKLKQAQDIWLSAASNLTDSLIYNLAYECPSLRRLGLKMLNRKRLNELESLKVDLRAQNLDLEVITFGFRYESPIIESAEQSELWLH